MTNKRDLSQFLGADVAVHDHHRAVAMLDKIEGILAMISAIRDSGAQIGSLQIHPLDLLELKRDANEVAPGILQPQMNGTLTFAGIPVEETTEAPAGEVRAVE